MKKFLSRLLNLEQPPPPPVPECPSCKIYEKWMQQLRTEADNNQAILAEENKILRQNLENSYARLHEDKEAERRERQDLEDTILKFTKLKGQPVQVVKVPVNPDGSPVPRAAGIPVRPGTAWGRMRHDLEKAARDKAQPFKAREEAEIRAGRMAPSGNEDLRETQTDPGEVNKSRQ